MTKILWLATAVLFVLKVAGVGAVAAASWWLVLLPALIAIPIQVFAAALVVGAVKDEL